MTIFKLNYFFLSITVCKHFGAVMGANNLADVNDAVIRNEMIVWLQNCDRGCVAKPNMEVEAMRSMSLAALNDITREAHDELICSYVYFAFTYLHLINIYVSDPKTLLRLIEEELNSILFTKESATMMALVHAFQDQQWDPIRPVMWIFHIFVEKVAKFLLKHRNRYLDTHIVYTSVIFPYNAIKTMLEVFTVNMKCTAYNQTSGRPDDMTYVDSIRNGLVGALETVISELASTKSRFWAQTDRNAQLGVIPFESRRFFVDSLLVGFAQDNQEVLITLEKKFGTQLKWQPIQKMLKVYYDRVINAVTKTSLQQYVIELSLYLYQFFRVLKAIAMRIVIIYLLQLRHTIKTAKSQIPPDYPYNLKRVADSLQAFKKSLQISDDKHLNAVINSLNKPLNHLKSFNQIGRLVLHIQRLLRDMSTPFNFFDINFDSFIKDKVNFHKLATNVAIEFAREIGINTTEDMENVMVIEVYVEFVKTITDFDVIGSFSKLMNTAWYRLFVTLEEEQQLRRP